MTTILNTFACILYILLFGGSKKVTLIIPKRINKSRVQEGIIPDISFVSCILYVLADGFKHASSGCNAAGIKNL